MMAVDRPGRSTSTRIDFAAGLRSSLVAGRRSRWRRAQAPEQAKPVEGFGESRRGDVPEGTLEMMTPETDQAIKNGLAWLAGSQNSDGSYGNGSVPGQHRRDEPGRAGVHVVGVEPGPGALRIADRQGPRLRDGEYVAVGLHRGARDVDSRADVFARVRHVVSGRSLRDDASAGDPRETAEGRPPDHRQPEYRRGMAVSAGPARRRSLGDDLPDQCAAGRAQCRACLFPRKRSTPASAM